VIYPWRIVSKKNGAAERVGRDLERAMRFTKRKPARSSKKPNLRRKSLVTMR